MAWIKIVNEDDAEGSLRETYDRLSGPTNRVDNILKIHSLIPKSLDDHYQLYKNLMTGRTGISRAQREMIAVVVSAVNECHY